MNNVITKDYKVAIYIRLSREDEKQGESESITNQRAFLKSWVLEQGYEISDIYIDDGFSGTNFNRPAFKRMLEDIDAGKINMVVTKDMSRLGRDYIGTGEFIEKYFQKGMKMELSGRIQTGSYTNQDGNRVYTTDVVAEQVGFAESKAASAQHQDGGGYRAQPASDPALAEDGFINIPDGIDDEELPF